MKKLIEQAIGTVSNEAYRFAWEALGADVQMLLDNGKEMSLEAMKNQLCTAVDFHRKHLEGVSR
jgi:hypothetical protein